MNIASSRSAEPVRLAFLDGVRAIAALWVMLGHLRLFALGWTPAPMWAVPVNLLLYLHYGVAIFLVLSGYCLALPAVRAGNRIEAGLKMFFLARALRILPPYLATLALILLANAVVPVVRWGRHDLGLTGEMPWQVFWTNVLLLQDVFPQYNNVNGPFWSVACEWHLYLVFPLLIWAMRRFGTAAMLAASGLLAVLLTVASDRVGRIPYIEASIPQPPFYVALLAMGIAAAALAHGATFAAWRERIFKWSWGMALICLVPLAMFLYEYPIFDVPSVIRHTGVHRFTDPLVGAVTAAVLVGLTGMAPTSWPRRLFERPALVRIGGYSYSLYLTHIPLLAALYELLQRLGLRPYQCMLVLLLVGVPLCLNFARMFAAVFERPIRWRPAAWRQRSAART